MKGQQFSTSEFAEFAAHQRETRTAESEAVKQGNCTDSFVSAFASLCVRTNKKPPQTQKKCLRVFYSSVSFCSVNNFLLYNIHQYEIQ